MLSLANVKIIEVEYYTTEILDYDIKTKLRFDLTRSNYWILGKLEINKGCVVNIEYDIVVINNICINWISKIQIM